MDFNNDELKYIVKKLKKGDKKALDKLFTVFYPKLYLFSKSFLKIDDDINDILQEVFITIWVKRKAIKNHENFEAYLFTITKNRLISYFRDKSRSKEFIQRWKMHVVSNESPLVPDVEFNDLSEKSASIVEQLPQRRKQIYKLSRENGLSYKEIALKLGISVKTVEDHMSHALRFLRSNLKKYDIISLLFFFLF